MTAVNSFKPIANPTARVLVLGSMPGMLSLQAGQYYAHPRNAFWRIMASLYGFSAELPYESRVQKLRASGVALWDVLHSCVRSGSLDSAIEAGSRMPNDFDTFFREHPHISVVGFNGAEAEKSFRRYALPTLNVSDIRFARLPSSSPAHAVPLEKKLAAWRAVLAP